MSAFQHPGSSRAAILGLAALALLGWPTGAGAVDFVLDPPSPSPFNAGDVLIDFGSPGTTGPPGVALSAASLGLLPNDVINALSFGDDPVDPFIHGPHAHLFSVTRGSIGVPGSGVNSERTADTPMGCNPGHPADIFKKAAGTIGNVLAPAGQGWRGGTQDGDEWNTQLNTCTPPGDSVNGLDISSLTTVGDQAPPFEVFYSLAPGSPTLMSLGATAGDILVSGGMYGATPTIFAAAISIGIPMNVMVDMDALSLEVTGTPPTLVAAEYSVSSATATGFALVGSGNLVQSGADIIRYRAAIVSASVIHHPMHLGLFATDDVDALETLVEEPPGVVIFDLTHVPLGDAELDPGQDHLLVENIGASGDDGVRMTGPSSVQLHAEHSVQSMNAQAGDAVTVTARGIVDGAEQEIAGVTLLPLDPATAVATADFPIAGVGGPLVAEVWNGTTQVANVLFEHQEDLLLHITGYPFQDIWLFETSAPEGAAAEENGGLAAAVSAWDMPFQQVVPITIQGKTYMGDRARVRTVPGTEQGEVWAVTGLDTTASGYSFNSIDVTNESVTAGAMFGGFAHQALGNAEITRTAGALVISNIGSAGEDGVHVPLGEAASAVAHLSRPGGWKDRTWKEYATGGSLDGVILPVLGTLEIDWTGGILSLMADASPIGATAFTVRIWDGDMLVVEIPGVVPGPGGLVATTIDTPDFLAFALDGPGLLSLSYGWDSEVPFTLLAPGVAGPISGNRIEVVAENPSGMIDSFTDFSVVLAYLPTIEFDSLVVEPLSAPCPADINGDGTVDVLDFLAVLASWGPCPGCPADINGDGTVDVVDFLQLLEAWGPCPSASVVDVAPLEVPATQPADNRHGSVSIGLVE
jgi:hypothetical protein